MNVKTRQVILSPATYHPDEAWVLAQTESFIEQAKELKLPIGMVQHDRDTKFTQKFRQTLSDQKIKPIRNPYRAPQHERLYRAIYPVDWSRVFRPFCDLRPQPPKSFMPRVFGVLPPRAAPPVFGERAPGETQTCWTAKSRAER